MMKELAMPDTYLPGDTRQRIQDLIKNRKITQAELAEKVGLSNSALSRYLQGGTKNLGDGYIIRIAKYFEVSTDFLLGETDIPDRKNYDIEELGLSAESAKLLYTGKGRCLRSEPADRASTLSAAAATVGAVSGRDHDRRNQCDEPGDEFLSLLYYRPGETSP